MVDQAGKLVGAVHITRNITERKKADEARRLSEEKFAKAFNSSPAAIFITTLKEGRFIDLNEIAIRVFGYTREEVLGHTAKELNMWANYNDRDIVVQSIQRGNAVRNMEARFRRKSGEVFDGIISVDIINIGRMECFISTIVDITERRQAEEKIKNLAKFPEENSNPVYRTSKDGVLLYANPASRRLVLQDQTRIGDKIPEKWVDMIKNAYDSGKRQQAEVELGGRVFLFDLVPVIEGGYVNSYATDITERKQVEDALREMRDYLENLINYANAPIIVWDPESKIVQFNHAFERLTSYQADEVIGQELSALFPVASRDKSLGKIAGTLGGEYWEVVEIPILCKDGEVRIALWNSANIYAKDGRTLLATIAQGTDITERKRTEEALRSSENKYRTLLKNLPQKIFLKDSNSVYISCNENYARDLKINPEEIAGKTDYDFYPKELAEKYRADDKRIISSGQTVEIEEKYIQDGREVIIHTVKTPVRDGQGNITGVLGIFWDITESKKMEDALRDSEEKYRDLFESARDAIITTDVEAKITGVNKLVEEYGFKKEQLVGKSIFDFIVEQHRERGSDDFKATISGNPVRGEMDVVTPRGIFTVEYVDNPIKRKGEIIGIQAVVRDITERKRGEQLLRKERDKAQKYLDVAGVVLVAIDSEQRVGLINRKGCEILGYKEEEILGKNWFKNFLPERVQREVQAIFQRLMCQQERTVPERYENPILTKSGEERLMAWHNTVLRDGAGKVIAALGSGEDITEQRKAEQKSLQYQSQLRSVASQLTVAEEREKHRIATELHDQIGQSLTISKIRVDALHQSMKTGEHAKVLEEVCNCLSKAIGQVRSLTFDLSSPILHQLGFEAGVGSWLAEEIEAKHHISTIFEDDKQAKPLDDDVRTILFRNVRELLINVVKHAKAHKMRVSVRKIGSQIQVDVQNDGVGFNPTEALAEAARKDKFGLFSVKERLEQIGGRFQIESEPGHGCIVTMTAPLKKEGEINDGRI